MLLALLLAQATAIDAERAFASDAKTIGQWTAFRKWSTPDATMFTPQPTNAHAFLKDRTDPPRAIEWWPTASYVSCDGTLAVNTGGWKQPDGSVGYFSTVWQRQADGGWKWIVDGGDGLKTSRPHTTTPKTVKASCVETTAAERPGQGQTHGAGASADGSLIWEWALNATGHTRVFAVSVWNGTKYVDGFEDLIDVP